MGSEVWFHGYEAAYNEADDKAAELIAQHDAEIERYRYELKKEIERRTVAEGQNIKLKKAIAPFAEAGKWIWRYNSNYSSGAEASVLISDLVKAHITIKTM